MIRSVESRPGGLRCLGKLTVTPSKNWRLKLHTYSAQVSEFFEPSIQSTVDTIRDNFKKRLTVNSVRIP